MKVVLCLALFLFCSNAFAVPRPPIEFDYSPINNLRLGMPIAQVERIAGQRIGLKKGESFSPYLGLILVAGTGSGGLTAEYVDVRFDKAKRLYYIAGRIHRGWTSESALSVLRRYGSVRALSEGDAAWEFPGRDTASEQFVVCVDRYKSLKLVVSKSDEPKGFERREWVLRQHYAGDGICE